MRTVIRHILGWSALALGVAGLFLPILQGWLFIAVGAMLLSPDVPFFRRLVAWIETRFPAIRKVTRRLRRKL